MKIILNDFLFLALFISVFDWIDCSLFRSSSSSYRAPSYRSSSSSYRSTTYRSSSYRASSYRSRTSRGWSWYRASVKSEVKVRYGGVTMSNKRRLYSRGDVYIWPGMYSYVSYNNLDDFAMCEGRLNQRYLNGTLHKQYAYFICPRSRFSDESYCCDQECCSYEVFTEIYCDSVNGTAYGCEAEGVNIYALIGGICAALIVVTAIAYILRFHHEQCFAMIRRFFTFKRRETRHAEPSRPVFALSPRRTQPRVMKNLTQAKTEYEPVPIVQQSMNPVGQVTASEYSVGQTAGPQYPTAPYPQNVTITNLLHMIQQNGLNHS